MYYDENTLNINAAHEFEGLASCLDYFRAINDPFSAKLQADYDKLYPGTVLFTAGSAATGMYRGLKLWEIAVNKAKKVDRDSVAAAFDRARIEQGPGGPRRDGAGQAPLQDEHVHRGGQERELRGGHAEQGPRRPQGVLGAEPPLILVLELALLAVGVVLPLVLDHFWVVLATRIVLICLPALSFDLLWGYSGIMSFGQALFYGTAAYSAALLARDLGFTSIFVIAPACTLIGLGLALIMAWFLLLGRYPPTTIFVALGTLTGAYAADRLARGWYYLGGQNGIPVDPAPHRRPLPSRRGPATTTSRSGSSSSSTRSAAVLVRSQFGLVLAGIRQQEERISFLGYRVQHFKAIVFTLAGGICGLAGALAAFHDGFVWPNMLGVLLSTQIVLYVLFGGVGTLVGAVIGVAEHRVRELPARRQLPDLLADPPGAAPALRRPLPAQRPRRPRGDRAGALRPLRPRAGAARRSESHGAARGRGRQQAVRRSSRRSRASTCAWRPARSTGSSAPTAPARARS